MGLSGARALGQCSSWVSTQAATKLNFYSFAKIHSPREREKVRKKR